MFQAETQEGVDQGMYFNGMKRRRELQLRWFPELQLGDWDDDKEEEEETEEKEDDIQ